MWARIPPQPAHVLSTGTAHNPSNCRNHCRHWLVCCGGRATSQNVIFQPVLFGTWRLQGLLHYELWTVCIPFGGVTGSRSSHPGCSSVVLSAPALCSASTHLGWEPNSCQASEVPSGLQVGSSLLPMGPLLVHSVYAQCVRWVSEPPEFSYRTWRWQCSNRKLLLEGIQVSGCSSGFKGAGVRSFRTNDLRFGMAGWNPAGMGNSEKE